MKKERILMDSSEWYEMAKAQIVEENLERAESESEEGLTQEELSELREKFEEEVENEIVNIDDVAEREINHSESVIHQIVEDYEKRYDTTVMFVAWVGTRSSHYGSIGGNGSSCVGVKPWCKGNSDVIIHGDNSMLTISIDKEDNGLNLDVYDHDGTNHTKLVLISESAVIKEKRTWENDFEVAQRIAAKKNPIKISKRQFESI